MRIPSFYFLALLVLAGFSLHPAVDCGLALFSGIVYALFIGNPYSLMTSAISKMMLMLCVVGLGAGIDLSTVASEGLRGIQISALSVLFTIVTGLLIGKLLRIESKVSVLITVGSAICGGSAISAVAPIIKAKKEDFTIALATIFILNSISLYLFPWLGKLAEMSQAQFGIWCAIAIHDTSSVVGALSKYGPRALEVGITVKLSRTLWIMPTVAALGIIVESGGSLKKFPWFIVGFVCMSIIFSFIPEIKYIGENIHFLSRRLLALTLFLIGSSLNKEALIGVGWRPFLQGACLWILISLLAFMLLKGNFLM